MSRQNIIESFLTAMPADATNAHALVHPDSAWCQSGRVVHELFGMGWLACYTEAGGDDVILCGDGTIDRFKPSFRD